MQAALLAGLPQAPSLYDPILYPQAALARRAKVLKALYDNGAISYDRYQAALRDTSLHLKPGACTRGSASRTSSATCATS